MPGTSRSDPTPEQSLRTAQFIAFALSAGAVLVTAAAIWANPAPRNDGLATLVLLAAIAGLVSPVIGFRLYLRLRETAPPDPSVSARSAVFIRATVVAVAVSEALAFLGVAVFLLTGGWAALVGVVTLVLLTGAIWPSRTRWEVFVAEDETWDREAGGPDS